MEASLPQQFSKVGAYGARLPAGQCHCQGPALAKDNPGHVLCLQALLPDNTPRMQYYVELTSLSYYMYFMRTVC